MVESYAAEPDPWARSDSAPWGRTQIGLLIGTVAGLMAGSGARRVVMVRWAFALLVVFAGVNSWWVMFMVAALNSTSGYGLDVGWVVGTVLSWVLAFAAFFGAALLMRWRSAHN